MRPSIADTVVYSARAPRRWPHYVVVVAGGLGVAAGIVVFIALTYMLGGSS